MAELEEQAQLLADRVQQIIAEREQLQLEADCGDGQAYTVNTQFFLVVMGSLVIFMQAGFALLEAGSIGVQSVVNILFKNINDMLLGALLWWAVGYAFAYGNNPSYPFIGDSGYFLQHVGLCEYANWFFQWTFAATAVTIVSGAVAGRLSMKAYFGYTILIAGFVYPTTVHWTWSSDAWLAEGDDDGGYYRDFAGSGIVHVTGGISALVGAYILGPRKGVFEDGQGKPHAHSLPMVLQGTLILFLGFIGFNGGSVLALDSTSDARLMSLAAVNTVMAGCGGGLTTITIFKVMDNIWNLPEACNGLLAGMVAICAGANTVYPWAAFVIGAIAGIVYFLWAKALTALKIDDAINASPVHLGAGIWGVIAVPLFSFQDSIFYDDSNSAWRQLGWAFAGVTVICLWAGGLMAILFNVLKWLGLLRYDAHDSLDMAKHGEQAYNMGGAIGDTQSRSSRENTV